MATNWKMLTIITTSFICLAYIFGFTYSAISKDTMETTTSTKNAIIQTTKGDIHVELYPQKAPKTVENFTQLAKTGYYNELTFHRVIPNFMIQGGDPLGNGTGGESYWKTSFEDEINADSLGLNDLTVQEANFLGNLYSPDVLQQYQNSTVKELYQQYDGYQYKTDIESEKMDVGSLAMANSGPNTNGSQFFIVSTRPQPHLDGKHTVFGKVTQGLDIVNQIEQGDIINTIIIQ